MMFEKISTTDQLFVVTSSPVSVSIETGPATPNFSFLPKRDLSSAGYIQYRRRTLYQVPTALSYDEAVKVTEGEIDRLEEAQEVKRQALLAPPVEVSHIHVGEQKYLYKVYKGMDDWNVSIEGIPAEFLTFTETNFGKALSGNTQVSISRQTLDDLHRYISLFEETLNAELTKYRKWSYIDDIHFAKGGVLRIQYAGGCFRMELTLPYEEDSCAYPRLAYIEGVTSLFGEPLGCCWGEENASGTGRYMSQVVLDWATVEETRKRLRKDLN